MWFKKKEIKSFHESFPEIFQWEIGDEVFLTLGCGTWYYRGLTDDSVVYSSNQNNDHNLHEYKFKHIKLDEIGNLSLHQRRLKIRMNDSEYSNFIKFCNKEYRRLADGT